ncbi:MAG: hypothetical protein ABIP79_04520 [Chitinophagaceae bacterium]
MKKVFLLIGIAGFTTASAQQQDFFDINSHLKKKNAEKSRTIPKTKLVFPKTIPFPLKPNKTSINYSFTLPNGDKVYTSPDYNMPVVVTDMRQFKTMPNAILLRPHSIVQFPKIPNASPPFLIPPMFK